jgi:hypothetical protein
MSPCPLISRSTICWGGSLRSVGPSAKNLRLLPVGVVTMPVTISSGLFDPGVASIHARQSLVDA